MSPQRALQRAPQRAPAQARLAASSAAERAVPCGAPAPCPRPRCCCARLGSVTTRVRDRALNCPNWHASLQEHIEPSGVATNQQRVSMVPCGCAPRARAQRYCVVLPPPTREAQGARDLGSPGRGNRQALALGCACPPCLCCPGPRSRAVRVLSACEVCGGRGSNETGYSGASCPANKTKTERPGRGRQSWTRNERICSSVFQPPGLAPPRVCGVSVVFEGPDIGSVRTPVLVTTLCEHCIQRIRTCSICTRSVRTLVLHQHTWCFACMSVQYITRTDAS